MHLKLEFLVKYIKIYASLIFALNPMVKFLKIHYQSLYLFLVILRVSGSLLLQLGAVVVDGGTVVVDDVESGLLFRAARSREYLECELRFTCTCSDLSYSLDATST